MSKSKLFNDAHSEIPSTAHSHRSQLSVLKRAHSSYTVQSNSVSRHVDNPTSNFRYSDSDVNLYFSVKQNHWLLEENVVCDFSTKYNMVKHQKHQLIPEIWRNCQTANPTLYNGTKFRLHSIDVSSAGGVEIGNLRATFRVGMTNYRDMLGTNRAKNRISAQLTRDGKQNKDNRQAHFSDALGVGALLITVDGFFVLLQRSKTVGEDQGMWDTPGGHPEPDKIKGLSEATDKSVYNKAIVHELFQSVLDEIHDELGIPYGELNPPRLMGVDRNKQAGGRPTAQFCVKTDLTRVEVENIYLKGNQREADESTDINFLTLRHATSVMKRPIWKKMAPSGKDSGMIPSKCHRFASQTVFATASEPVAICCSGNLAFVASEDFRVVVHDLSEATAPEVTQFSTCGRVKQIQYCEVGNIIACIEQKPKSNPSDGHTARCYVNWERFEGGTANRIRSAIMRRSSLSTRRKSSVASDSILTDAAIVYSGMDVLEFRSLSRPTHLATLSHQPPLDVPGAPHNWEGGRLAVTVNACVVVYGYRMTRVEDCPIGMASVDCFQHLFTVNFNFVLCEVALGAENYLGVSSVDEIQIIRVMPVGDPLSSAQSAHKSLHRYSSGIIVEVEEASLPSVSGARRHSTTQPRVRPREILGPTSQLDTASVTVIKDDTTDELLVETMIYRKFAVSQFDCLHSLIITKMGSGNKREIGVLVATSKMATQYAISGNHVRKLTTYSFSDPVQQICFSSVNLVHAATSTALITYTSRFTAHQVSSDLYSNLSTAEIGNQHFIGLQSVCPWSDGVLVCTKFVLKEAASDPEKHYWSLYSLRNQPRSQTRADIVCHCAEFEGTHPFTALHLFAESLLLHATSSELLNGVADNNDNQIDVGALQRLITLCFRVGGKYPEYAGKLLLLDALTTMDAIDIARELESQDFDIIEILTTLTSRRLLTAHLANIQEDGFLWLTDRLFNLSPHLCYEFILTNQFENSLRLVVDVLETSPDPECSSGRLVRCLYEVAHTRQNEAQTWFKRVSQRDSKMILTRSPYLLYNNANLTRFGWFIAAVAPQIFADVIVQSIDRSLTSDVDLEGFKKLGDCSYILVLEALIHDRLQAINRSISRRSSSTVAARSKTEEMVGGFVDQLIRLYEELSCRPPIFCLHKTTRDCRVIPDWLLGYRDPILNSFPPFNGIDPLQVKHTHSSSSCVGYCCQSYLIRLQALMSWASSMNIPNGSNFPGDISVDFPGQISLHFILVQRSDSRTKGLTRIQRALHFLLDTRTSSTKSAITTPDNHSNSKPINQWDHLNVIEIADRYLHAVYADLSIADWRVAIPLCKGCSIALQSTALHLASSALTLTDFLKITESNQATSSVAGDRATSPAGCASSLATTDWIEVTARRKWNQSLYIELIDQLKLT